MRILLKWKQRKIRKLEQQITEYKSKLEPFKDRAEFVALANPLNSDLQFKDQETKNRKKNKYQRDKNDYATNQVFKWQNNVKEGDLASANSSPEREVRITNEPNSRPL